MSNPDPSSRFPNTLFTSGTGRSRILDFDIPGGEQGAYDLLELDRRSGDEVLHKRAKEILLQEFNALRDDVSYRSKRLAAVAIIACARSPTERAKRSALPGRWDSLVGLVYAAEAQYALETIQLPLPGPVERWDDRTDKTLPPLMPATFVSFAPQKLTEVDEEEEETSSSSSVLPGFFPEFTSLLADMHTNTIEYLIDGELSPGPAGFTVNPLMGACPPTRRGRIALPPDEPLQLEGGLAKGMGGINRSQLNQLRRGGGMRSMGVSGGNFKVSYAGEDRKERRRAAKAKAIEPANWDGELESVRKELNKQLKEAKEIRVRLSDMMARITSRTAETLEATVQTDPLPPPDPLIITRPSSPAFLSALPSNEKELELLEEVDKLKEDVRFQRAETEKVKARLRTTTLENDDLHLRLQSSDSLLSLIHHTRPLVATVCKRFEPLTAVLPVAAVDWATEMGMKAVEGIMQREESEIGRLRREIEQLEKQLEAVNSSSSALARSASLAAHAAHSLSAPSGRAAYATWRLGEQVKALTREVREMREENVDLIVRLSQ